MQPYATEELWLDPTQSNFKYPIEADLAKKNLVIEVQDERAGLKQMRTYFSAKLRVRIIENFGELKVFVPNSNG